VGEEAAFRAANWFGVRRAFLLVLLAVVGACGRSSTQELRVTLRRSTGDTRRLIIHVPVSDSVATGHTDWRAEFGGQCDSDGRTLVLRNTLTGQTSKIGADCAWTDETGPVSRDGRFMVAWKPLDGAASTMHLLDLTRGPSDTGAVPMSTTASYSAAWTRDNRVWFIFDSGPDSSLGTSERLTWFHPGDRIAHPGPVMFDLVTEVSNYPPPKRP
jgi:hypothetical protein